MKSPLSVLVVEDEPLLLEAISKKLTISGITPIACISGTEALEKLRKKEIAPDAVWLDYQLKDMDGMTFMSSLKENNFLPNVPVIVISNSMNKDKVYRMLALGAKQYLLKAEHRLEDIIATIRDLINEKK